MKTFDLSNLCMSQVVTALIYMRSLTTSCAHRSLRAERIRESFKTIEQHYLAIYNLFHSLLDFNQLKGPGWIYLEIHEFDFK